MVFHRSFSLSSTLSRSFQTINFSTILQNVAATRKQKLFYIFNFAVVYAVQKRSFRKSAVKLKEDGHCPTMNPFNKHMDPKMCSLRLERKHNILIEKYKSNYCTNQRQFYKDALFVLGPMGSGKTTFINNKILTHKVYKNYAYVDTDEIMEKLPGFNNMEVNRFYPLARQIAIKLTDWLLENQLSFVAEGTCVQYQELIDYMIRLKRHGYTIKVCKLAAVDLDLVLERAARRKTRKMDSDQVKDIYIQSKLGLNYIFKYNNEDAALFEHIKVEDL